jgi:septal ring-binding cell division protein DamX
MLRLIPTIVLTLVFLHGIEAQEVMGSHDVQPGSVPNEYNIKTTIKGLQGVDIARIKYIIDNEHTYKPSPNNALFSDRNESYIKFYIMAVPSTGELVIELGVVLADGGDYAFPVEFQYSKNEVKETINLPQISLSGNEIVADIEEVPEVVPEPVVEEVAPVVEEVPEVVSEPVVEEVVPVVEEIAEATPEPVVEEVVPVVEEASEVITESVVEEIAPVVEEAPEVVPEPVVEEVAPVVEEVPEVVPEPVIEEVVPVVEEVPEVVSEPVVEEVAPVVEEVPEVVPEPVVEEVVPVVEEEPEIASEPIVEEVAPVVEEVPEVVEAPIPPPTSSEANRTAVKYTVQILSLSKFSQARLNTYCKQHGLSVNDVAKRQVGEWMKITYGEANSIEEAKEIKEKLMRDYNVNEAFVTPIKY